MKKAFTLVEMMVVIGILGILMAIAGFSFSAIGTANQAKGEELCHQVAIAMTQLFNEKGRWPRALLANNGAKEGKLDENAAYPLRTLLSLSTENNRLSGYDRFGILTPWAMEVVKKRGAQASRTDKIPSGGTIDDHTLRYALDTDGDGIIEGATVGGESVDVRATCIVWSCGKDGKIEAYSTSVRHGSDDCYSWDKGKTEKVK